MENARELERNLSQGFTSSLTEQLQAPTILLSEDGAHSEKLNGMRSKALREIDLLDEMLMELMLVRSPELKKTPEVMEKNFENFRNDYFGNLDGDKVGSWVLYGNGTLLHILLPEEHYELRTSRNIGLLTEDEQKIFSQAHVAVGGLSVGGLCATTLAMEGVKSFYLTDFDKLATSNLNRIQSSLSYVGVDKTDIVAEKILDIDPFCTVERDTRGFVPESVSAMFNTEKLPNVVIDAMDSMEAKIAIREECRKHRIPLVWMIDMGDGIVQVGTERYDINPDYPAFHGSLSNKEMQLERSLDYLESCFSIFNNERLPFRMAQSFMDACNNEGAGISQLAGTVSIAAGAISKVVRKILLGQTVVNEFFVDIDQFADPEYSLNRKEDQTKTIGLMKELGLVDA